MKKLFVLALAVCFLLCGCTSAKTAINPGETVSKILTDNSITGGDLYSSDGKNGDVLDSDMVLGYYGDAGESPDFSVLSSYCVYIDETNPTFPCELGVFVFAEGKTDSTFMQYLKARIDDKIKNAVNYPSIDKETLEKAVYGEKNGCVYYVVVKDKASEIGDYINSLL